MPLLALLALLSYATACASFPAAPQPGGEAGSGGYSIIFLGDTSFRSRYVARNTFEPIQAVFRPMLEEADHVIANLEAPVTDRPQPALTSGKLYVHAEDISTSPGLLRGLNVKAVSLANNHILDYGEEGLFDTISHISGAGMAIFGAGGDSLSACRPLTLRRESDRHVDGIYVLTGFQYFERYDLDYRFYAGADKAGVACLDDRELLSQIKAIRAKEPAALIILYPHWGIDYQWKDNSQSALAARFIGAGVDLIIGHGSHVLQEIEYVQGRLVVYGLGNFIFSSSGRYDQKAAHPYSFIARLWLPGAAAGRDGIKVRLYPIVTDNLLTDYRPRFVGEKEFNWVFNRSLDMSGSLHQRASSLLSGGDEHGFYLELPLRQGG